MTSEQNNCCLLFRSPGEIRRCGLNAVSTPNHCEKSSTVRHLRFGCARSRQQANIIQQQLQS
eukprot:6204970-Pleurochrysis_carterae.AAC.2